MVMRLAWLSSSSAEIARARNVLKALTPGGVIDELGFLVLQGAFADYFYPAVTTPMTRARYLIFVPAVYQYLERSGKAVGRDVDRVARDLQFNLLQSLLETDPDGAIGREKGRNVIRTPSDTYWSALASLGLATQKVSEASYQRRLSAGGFRGGILKDDDSAPHPEDEESLWDASLRLSSILSEGAFPAGTSFRLRRKEAELLLQRYEGLNEFGHDSLIVQMVLLARQRRLSDLAKLDHLWQIPGLKPRSLAAAQHARLLSLFARGVTLQYHRMLIEKKNATDTGAGEAFVAWWQAAQEDLSRWDLDEFFALIRHWDADRRPLYDRQFIREWRTRCATARSAKRALDDPEARLIIGQREDRVRPGKQRLRVKYQLDSFRVLPAYPTDVIYQLQYRHPVGRRFAEDIATGLEAVA
jgi:hypothetical protein